MIITAAELKKTLKVFAPIKTESYQIGEHGVSASDSDAWVIADSPLSGLGGCFSVNGKKLSQVVNRMSGQIEIERQDKLLSLKSARAKIELEIQNIKPLKIPEASGKTLTSSLSDFKKAVALGVASASPNKSAAFGGVVQIQSLPLGIEDVSPSGYQIIGTDSQVLTVVTISNPIPFELKVLLNLEAAAVVQLMDGTDLTLSESNTHLYLAVPGTRLFVSKSVQQYPDFSRHLASQPKLKFKFNPEEWLSAMKTVEPLMDETVDQGGISVHLSDSVVVFSNISVGSTAQDEAGYEQVDPDPIFEPATVKNLKVRAKYLSGFLAKATGETTMGLIDKNSPIRLESGNVQALMMPLASKKETK